MKRNWRRSIIYLILLGVCLVALAAPFYNRLTPSIFGLPFFIWFQMLWVVVAALATALALRATAHRN